MGIRSFIDRRPFVSALIFVVIGLSIMIALTSCATTASPAAVPMENVKQTPPPIDRTYLMFGDVYEYDDGVFMTVTTPVEFEPSESAKYSSTPLATGIFFDIVVINQNAEPFTLDTSPIVTYHESWEAPRIEDNEVDFGPILTTPGWEISPGEEVRWTVAYSVDSLDELTVRVRPTFDHEELRFTNILP